MASAIIILIVLSGLSLPPAHCDAKAAGERRSSAGVGLGLGGGGVFVRFQYLCGKDRDPGFLRFRREVFVTFARMWLCRGRSSAWFGPTGLISTTLF